MKSMYGHNYENDGLYLEEQMFKAFAGMGFKRIIREDDLIRQFGFEASSIDYMLETECGRIVLQLKYRRSRRRENKAVQNFLRSVEFVKNKMQDKPILFGIWSSRIEPFEDNKVLLQSHNIVTVSLFDDLYGLVDRTKETLTSLNNMVAAN